jgi:phytoene dehydrogenase-like protein
MGDDDLDVIVVGGGAAGAVCAASLALRGARTLLVAETDRLGHNFRSVELDGHRAIIQNPSWHFAWGGGNWARVVREQNLASRVHLTPPIWAKVRGGGTRVRLPVMLSAATTCDALFQLLPIPVDDEARAGVERVLHAGYRIPPEELFLMHDVSLGEWLDDVDASDLARLVLEFLAAAIVGLPAEFCRDKLSVFGTFVHIRTYLGGEGIPAIIEPDTQIGFVEPLGERVEALGGRVWRGTHVERVLVEDGRVRGVRMVDGRTAVADQVAMAVGNTRLPALFDALPSELRAPLEKEAAYRHHQLMVLTLLERPVLDLRGYLVLQDPATGSNVWGVPLHETAPWNSPDDRQLVLQWWGGHAESDPAKVLAYLDEVFEEEFPGWTAAIGTRACIDRRHHWMNPCYTGPKVPRRSPTIDGLWYVGESTEPVAGIALEQATYAGYSGALEIAGVLGRTALSDLWVS